MVNWTKKKLIILSRRKLLLSLLTKQRLLNLFLKPSGLLLKVSKASKFLSILLTIWKVNHIYSKNGMVMKNQNNAIFQKRSKTSTCSKESFYLELLDLTDFTMLFKITLLKKWEANMLNRILSISWLLWMK